MSDEYVMIYTFGADGIRKLVKVEPKEQVPTSYFGYKCTTTDEIIFVSFSTVPSVADTKAYMLVGVNGNEDIKADLNVRKLIEEDFSSNFTYISDSSFSITFTGKGTFTYEKLGLDVPIKYNAEVESNKQVTIDQWDYSEPVEITPTQGKNVLDSVTVTLSRPVVKMYCWRNNGNTSQYLYTLIESTDCGFAFQSGAARANMDIRGVVGVTGTDYIAVRGYETTANKYARYPDKDIIINKNAEVLPSWWNDVPPSGKTFFVLDKATGLSYNFASDGSSTLATLNETAATAKGVTAGTLILTYNDTTNYCCDNVVS